MKKLTIVIPAWPNIKIDALESIRKQGSSVSYIVDRGLNPSKSRNNGAKKAKADFVAFINTHTVLSDNWFKEVKDFFKKYPEIDVVGGPQLTHNKEGFFQRMSGYALSSIFTMAHVADRYKEKRLNLNADENTLTSANLICKRKVIEKIKFNEEIYPGEDPYFILEAKAQGFKAAYSPSIIAYNKRRDSFSAFAKQIFNYGKARPRILSSFKSSKTNLFSYLFFVPSLFLIYLLVSPTLIALNWFFALPLLLYLILSLFFALKTSLIKKDWRAIFMMPPIYLLIHISYGIGFIVGLFSTLRK